MKKNTIVLQQGRTASRWQHAFLKELGLKVFHEPIGGWEGGKFGKPLSWSHYLNTRMSCRPSNFPDNPAQVEKFDGMDLKQVIEAKEYIEVGYASLPFAVNIPFDWRVLGVIRHPQTWIYSAVTYQFFNAHYDWCPSTYKDYAQLWIEHNTTIWERAERVYRTEDLLPNCDMFAQEFEHYKELTKDQIDCYVEWRSDDAQKRHEKTINEDDWQEWWGIVEPLAEKLGYRPIENYQLPNRTKEVVKKELGVDQLTTWFKRDYGNKKLL